MRGKSRESEEREQRDREIRRLRFVEKWTYERIAEEFGITKQRVFQITKNGRE
jgi:DNA-directed RNA polymerase specialized sigma subunit